MYLHRIRYKVTVFNVNVLKINLKVKKKIFQQHLNVAHVIVK